MKQAYTLLMLVFTFMACAQKQDKHYTAPMGYDFNQPVIVKLPHQLQEISGISFHEGNPESLYAEQDEDGYIFYFNPNESSLSIKESKFGKKGDYEDITITANHFVLLRSDGTLYTFPFAAKPAQEINNVQEWQGLVPKGEYEGLATDQRQLYILCKQCAIDKKEDETTGYVFNFTSGTLKASGLFKIDNQQIDKQISLKGRPFRPSALAKNPLTKEWFILSSINRMLIVTDEDWQVKAVHALNPKLFNQPEGMAFDSNGNLYISNEAGSKSGKGTVLKFPYSKP